MENSGEQAGVGGVSAFEVEPKPKTSEWYNMQLGLGMWFGGGDFKEMELSGTGAKTARGVVESNEEWKKKGLFAVQIDESSLETKPYSRDFVDELWSRVGDKWEILEKVFVKDWSGDSQASRIVDVARSRVV